MSSSSASVIDFSIDRDAPFSWLTFWSPRLADRAAPAAFCWAWDFAGMLHSVFDLRRNGSGGCGFAGYGVHVQVNERPTVVSKRLMYRVTVEWTGNRGS